VLAKKRKAIIAAAQSFNGGGRAAIVHVCGNIQFWHRRMEYNTTLKNHRARGTMKNNWNNQAPVDVRITAFHLSLDASVSL